MTHGEKIPGGLDASAPNPENKPSVLGRIVGFVRSLVAAKAPDAVEAPPPVPSTPARAADQDKHENAIAQFLAQSKARLDRESPAENVGGVEMRLLNDRDYGTVLSFPQLTDAVNNYIIIGDEYDIKERVFAKAKELAEKLKDPLLVSQQIQAYIRQLRKEESGKVQEEPVEPEPDPEEVSEKNTEKLKFLSMKIGDRIVDFYGQNHNGIPFLRNQDGRIEVPEDNVDDDIEGEFYFVKSDHDRVVEGLQELGLEIEASFYPDSDDLPSSSITIPAKSLNSALRAGTLSIEIDDQGYGTLVVVKS